MADGKRPVLDLPYRPADYLAEIIALLALAGQLVFAVLSYPNLPATIPIHFGFNGKPNNYGGREWVFFTPAMALVLYLGLTLLSRFPQSYNYPWRVTEANAPRLYRVSRALLLWLKAEMCVIFAFATWLIVHYATQGPGPYDFWFVPVLVALILGTSIFGIVQMRPATWKREK